DEDGASITLPGVVEEILLRLGHSLEQDERNSRQAEFLRRLNEYGSVSGSGYNHDRMFEWPAYNIRFAHSFMRAYDMNDAAIDVLRRSDVSRITTVRPES